MFIHSIANPFIQRLLNVHVRTVNFTNASSVSQVDGMGTVDIMEMGSFLRFLLENYMQVGSTYHTTRVPTVGTDKLQATYYIPHTFNDTTNFSTNFKLQTV